MDRVHSELQNVFRRIFNDDELVITDGTKAADIDGWDSLAYINLIPAGSVVMGNPAKVTTRVEDLIRFWEAEAMVLPWAELIARREGAFDAAMEPELRRIRQEHFFKNGKPSA
jgi:hypothetical protein